MSLCGWVGAGAGLQWPSGSAPHPIFVTGGVYRSASRSAQSGSSKWGGMDPRDETKSTAKRALRMGMESPVRLPPPSLPWPVGSALHHPRCGGSSGGVAIYASYPARSDQDRAPRLTIYLQPTQSAHGYGILPPSPCHPSAVSAAPPSPSAFSAFWPGDDLGGGGQDGPSGEGAAVRGEPAGAALCLDALPLRGERRQERRPPPARRGLGSPPFRDRRGRAGARAGGRRSALLTLRLADRLLPASSSRGRAGHGRPAFPRR